MKISPSRLTAYTTPIYQNATALRDFIDETSTRLKAQFDKPTNLLKASGQVAVNELMCGSQPPNSQIHLTGSLKFSPTSGQIESMDVNMVASTSQAKGPVTNFTYARKAVGLWKKREVEEYTRTVAGYPRAVLRVEANGDMSYRYGASPGAQGGMSWNIGRC